MRTMIHHGARILLFSTCVSLSIPVPPAHGDMVIEDFVQTHGCLFLDVGMGPDFHHGLASPLAPYLAVEPAWQALEGDAEGLDLQAEIGYRSLSLVGEFTRYNDERTDGHLNLRRLSILVRSCLEGLVEVDVGFGALSLRGRRELNEFAFSVPIRIHPDDLLPFGFEFRPAWSASVSDYDIAMYFTMGTVALKGGYHWVTVPGESLNGPYIGLSLRL